MLRGNYPATVDGKGRLKIPTAFKIHIEETYGPDFYITSLDGQSVRVYPFSVWRGIEEKLAALPSLNKAKKKFLDRTNYWGQTAKMDAQGRVLIPSMLREWRCSDISTASTSGTKTVTASTWSARPLPTKTCKG
ncbi:MAG: division/cell wall cluster transcriptional repressor MraZ [Terriglobia bacterium]